MKHINIPLLVLILSLTPYFYSVSNCAEETIVRTKAEVKPSNIQPSTQPYKLTKDRSSANMTTEEAVNDYLERGTKTYPLPDDRDVLLEELNWHNDFKNYKNKIN